jgi:chromosome segregation ATPase
VKANVLEHRPIDEVLASWEHRVAQQAGMFQKFATDVVSVDKQLIQSARRLRELSDEHSVMKEKSQNIDSAIKAVWDHQEALGKLLSHIQDELGREKSSGSHGAPGNTASERAAGLWSQLNDMESEIDDVVSDIERMCSEGTGTASGGGNLTSLVKLIKLHAHSIATVQQQTSDIAKNIPS